jgi:hypothetical protein
MGNIIDFAELRRRIEQHDAEARRKAREIHERMKRDEHCDPEFWEATDIFYPWDERPWDMPLHPYETDIVMRVVNMDMALVAKKFHMTVERLEAELLNERRWRGLALAHRRERLRAKEAEAERKAAEERARLMQEAMFTVETINGRELKLRVRKPGFPHNVALTRCDDGYVLHVIDSRMQERHARIGTALEAVIVEGLDQGAFKEPKTKAQREMESRMKTAAKDHFK